MNEKTLPGVLARRWRAVREGDAESGMATSEYAVGILAAVSFAVVLIAIVKSAAVKTALTGISIDWCTPPTTAVVACAVGKPSSLCSIGASASIDASDVPSRPSPARPGAFQPSV